MQMNDTANSPEYEEIPVVELPGVNDSVLLNQPETLAYPEINEPNLDFVIHDIVENEVYGHNTEIQGKNGIFLGNHLHQIGDDIELTRLKIKSWFTAEWVTDEYQLTTKPVKPTNHGKKGDREMV